jgi:hypothetical protein
LGGIEGKHAATHACICAREKVPCAPRMLKVRLRALY